MIRKMKQITPRFTECYRWISNLTPTTTMHQNREKKRVKSEVVTRVTWE